MTHRKSMYGFVFTPLMVIITVAAVIMLVEFVIMLALHEILIPTLPFKLTVQGWDAVDAVLLTATVSPLLYYLVFRKITDSETRYRQINASAKDAIIIIDDQARITDWNLAAEQMFQYRHEEAVGQNIHQLITPERYHVDAQRGFAHFSHTGEGAILGKTIEVLALRRDGSEFPVELSISAVKLKQNWHAIGIIRDITERRQQKERTDALLELAISVECLDEKALLQLGLDTLQRLTNSRIGFLHFVSEDQKEIKLTTWSTDTLAHYCQAAYNGHYPVSDAGIWVDSVSLQRPVIINDYATAPARKGLPEGHSHLQRFISVPIIDDGLVRMIIGVGNSAINYDEYDIETVRLLGYNLLRSVQRKWMQEEKLETGLRTRKALTNLIDAIATTLEQRDPYTAGHQRRVAKLAMTMAEEMGLPPDMVEGVYFGGLIHDIGKISVPTEILGKPGCITNAELDLIKAHAEDGYRIMKDIAFPWPVADMVRQHHERWDGTGYPQGLVGEQIILEARILAVADVMEAMSSNRPYRKGLGMEAALDGIARMRGVQLDPVAVDACLRVIREQGFVFPK